ncbi:Imm30 family immunity protein [Granulicella mallensis]|uniref:Imm30 family immunity protein n=1 Tax=Granulicella mallensis TaxID=940614 RepID=UPI0009FD8EC5|nr:Imm30 family immunity protein [Granulicella mallensis]
MAILVFGELSKDMTQEQLAHLRDARFLRNPDEVNTFESALSEIKRQGNVTQPEAEELYRIFADSSSQQDVLWRLLHLIEHLDQSV